MSEHEITITFSNEGSRNAVRMRIINVFSNEEPGTGNKEKTSRYKYYVETLNDGNRIYLQRPAFLHNGFDFLICVENIDYSKPTDKRKRNSPKHEDIEEDLKLKKLENPGEYKRLYSLCRKVYECHDVSEAELSDFTFSSGLPVDHIVKVMKWLFIEQDIRYWNSSGRIMTWEIVPPVE